MFPSRWSCILLLLKVKRLWGTLSRLCEKQISAACLVGSGLKFLNVTVNTKTLCNLKTFACFINNKFSKKKQKHFIESISIQKVSLLASQLIDLLLREQYKTFIEGDANWMFLKHEKYVFQLLQTLPNQLLTPHGLAYLQWSHHPLNFNYYRFP